jgi:hypothetical protein
VRQKPVGKRQFLATGPILVYDHPLGIVNAPAQWAADGKPLACSYASIETNSKGRLMTRTTIVALLAILSWHTSSMPIASAIPLNRGDFSPAAVDIDFEGFPTHTLISTQYQPLGAVFTTIGGTPQANADNIPSYGPLASGNILATGVSLGSDHIEMSFVDPISGLPAATAGVGADIIFRDTGTVATLEVFDAAMSSLGLTTTAPDLGGTDEVFLGFSAPGIYKAVFTFAANDTFAGIDNLIFERVPEPSSLAMIALASISLSPLRKPRK